MQASVPSPSLLHVKNSMIFKPNFACFCVSRIKNAATIRLGSSFVVNRFTGHISQKALKGAPFANLLVFHSAYFLLFRPVTNPFLKWHGCVSTVRRNFPRP